MNYVYLLKCRKIGGKVFYIGCTSDLKTRFKQHMSGEVRTTKNRNPKLLYYEAYTEKYLALEREKALKTSGSVYNSLLRRLKLK